MRETIAQYEKWFEEDYAEFLTRESEHYGSLKSNLELPHGMLRYGFTLPDPTPEGYKRLPVNFPTGRFNDFYLHNSTSPGVVVRFHDFLGSGYDYRPVNFKDVLPINDKRDWAKVLLSTIRARGIDGQNPLLSGGFWSSSYDQDRTRACYATLRPHYVDPGYNDPVVPGLQWMVPPPDNTRYAGMVDNQLIWMSGPTKDTAKVLVMLNPQISWKFVTVNETLTTAVIPDFDLSLCEDSPPRYDGHVLFVSDWRSDFTAYHATMSFTKCAPETTSAIDICRSYTSIGYPPSPPKAPGS